MSTPKPTLERAVQDMCDVYFAPYVEDDPQKTLQNIISRVQDVERLHVEGGVPSGYQLVPTTLTQQMTKALIEATGTGDVTLLEEAWGNILLSCPKVEIPVNLVATELGSWLSAALDDPAVCQEFKDCIIKWMNLGEPPCPK